MRHTALLLVAVVGLTSFAAVAPATAAPEGSGDLLSLQGKAFYRTDAAFGSPQKIAEEPTALSVSDPVTSGDGTRFAYVRDIGTEKAPHEQVVVRFASGALDAVPVDAATDPAGTGSFYGDLSLSVTGDRLAFATSDHCNRVTPVEQPSLGANGANCEMHNVRQLKQDQQAIFLDEHGQLRQGNLSGNFRGYPRVPGVDEDLASFELSGDGSHLVYSLRGFSSQPLPEPMRVATLDYTGGIHATSITTLTDNPSGWYPPSPAFSLDGTRIYYRQTTRTCCSSDDTDLAYFPVGGGASVPVTDTAAVDEPPVHALAPVGTAPAAPTAASLVFDATHTYLQWTNNAVGADAVVITRETFLGATQTTVLPPDQHAWTDSGLSQSREYTYSIRARGTDGQVSSPLVLHYAWAPTTAYAPFVTSDYATQLPFPVNVSQGTTVEWSDLTAGTAYQPWAVDTSGPQPVFGRDGGTHVVVGHAYAFRSRGHDRFGNASTTTTSVGRVPFDQSSMAFTGTTATITGSTLWRGAARVLRPGATATFSTTARTYLIGTQCPTCGTLLVYRGSTLVARIGSYAARRVDRIVLGSVPAGSTARITVRVEPTTSSRRDAVLDGFAVDPA